VLPALLAARELIEQDRWSAARELLAGADGEYVWTHDGMRNLNVRMQEAVYARFGRTEGDRIADHVYQRMTDWAFGATDAPGFREQVETFAMLWQWHRTPVRIVEDDERVSYIMGPCGSGGRLINAGAYLPSAARPLTVLEEPSFASFGEAHFPNWCAHCAFSNRGYLTRSMPYFLLEGWSDHRRWGGCAAHSYKDIALVPAEAFERVGLEPHRGAPPPVAARVFTDAELAELARPVAERIAEAVDRHDAPAAIDLIERSWTAWSNLHNAYRCWYAMFADQLVHEDGPGLAARLVEETSWDLVAPVLEDPAASADTWTHFWANHVGRVGIEESPSVRLLTVPRDAIVHSELEQPIAEELAARLAAGICAGVTRAGHGAAFGVLRYADGRFEHALPRRAG
jgi:hypothetical protein